MTTEPLLLPNDLCREDSVIYAVLVRPALFPKLALEPEDFYYLEHRQIWEAFARIHDDGRPIDYVPLLLELRAMGRDDANVIVANIGVRAEPVDVLLPSGPYDVGRVPLAGSFAFYASRVRDGSQRRRLVQAAQAIAERAWDWDTPFDPVMAHAYVDEAVMPPAVIKVKRLGSMDSILDL